MKLTSSTERKEHSEICLSDIVGHSEGSRVESVFIYSFSSMPHARFNGNVSDQSDVKWSFLTHRTFPVLVRESVRHLFLTPLSSIYLSPAILNAVTFVLLFAGLCQVAMAVLICHTKFLMVLSRC